MGWDWIGELKMNTGGYVCVLTRMDHRGQYSDAVLSELESQNDAQVEGMTAKVKMLKDVRLPASDNSFPFICLQAY